MNGVLRHIRRAALLRSRDGPSDAQLLDSFLTRRDEAAFEALLRRHGPMVLGVCRRVLRHTQDAEDAFQATFLVFARKAGSLQSRELLGNWLYGVAQRTAMKARAMSKKRRARERRAAELSRPAPPHDDNSDELLLQLDAALARLPDTYRVPVVLCELEGKSRKEAARLMGLPEGTLSWRLAQARKLLARKLARYGVGAVALALAPGTATGRVPPLLLNATARAALQVASGKVLATGAVSTQVVQLTEGVIKAMLLSKLKAVWVLVASVALTAGAAGLGYRAVAAEPGQAGDRPQAGRSADELEELRLEIAALRRGLEATRARVKTLESQVQTLKTRNTVPGEAAEKADVLLRQRAAETLLRSAGEDKVLRDELVPDSILKDKVIFEGRLVPADAKSLREVVIMQDRLENLADRQKASADLLAEAEAALKKLRSNANDKQAVDALERALQGLKKRDQGQDLHRANKAPAKP